jgi:hypothetical protein
MAQKIIQEDQVDLTSRVKKTGDVMTGELNFTVVGEHNGSIILAKPDLTSDLEFQIFGGNWNTTFDDSTPDVGVRLGGNYLALESSDISIQLNSAQVGSRVIVAGLTERGNSILGVEPPPIPDYVEIANGTTDVEIYAAGTFPSPWVAVGDPLTIIQDIAANTGSVSFELLVENTGNKAGTVEIGVGLNGVDPTTLNSIAYSMGVAIKQVYASTTINVNDVPAGTTARLMARAAAGTNGFHIFARNAERPSLLKVTVLGSGGGSGGTVTSVGIVTSSLSVTGSPIVSSGNITVNLNTVPVIPGNYTSANISVDAFGRVTAAANGSGGGGGGSPAGNDTEIQFNSLGNFGASPNLTWTGTQLGINGNLELKGTARRFIADFSSTPHVNRGAFQTSVVNQQTTINVLPNGTGNSSAINLYNASDPTNSSYAGLFHISTGFNNLPASLLISGFRGTGALTPLAFSAGGSVGMVLDIVGNTIVGRQAPITTTATDGFIHINSAAGIPTGTPTVPIGFTAASKVPITVDSTTGTVYAYAAGAWHAQTGGGGGGGGETISPFLLMGG